MLHHHDFATQQMGNLTITALSDGDMTTNLDILSDISPETAQQLQRAAGIGNPGNIHINGYLVRGNGHTILIDTGTGGINHVGGQLLKNLIAAGVTPDEVETILLTHGHPDHLGGLLDTDGQKVFSRASLFIHPREAEYWQSDIQRHQASERGQRNFALARRVLNVYAQDLCFLTSEPLADTITPIWLPGHTPGHTGFLIDSKDKKLLIWGDIVHFPTLQSSYPDIAVMFDHCPAQAIETRKKIFAQAAQEKWLIAGMHLGETAFAYLEPDRQGYRMV
jgi:glyoxylase-like metal-dependent hydrolase (beta-lactamase superfamily II)